jgi:hypothetical protein
LKSYYCFTILLFSLLLTGCGSGNDGGEPAPILQSIQIVNIEETYLAGGQYTISLQGSYSDGRNTTLSGVTWGSSSSSVATINSNGNITTFSEGTTTITASILELTTSIDISIIPDTPARLLSINVQITDDDIAEGTTTQAQALGTYSDSSTRSIDVEWQTSDMTVASINSEGVITGLGAGQVQISAVSSDVSSNVDIFIFDIKSITIDVVGDYREHEIPYTDIYNRYIELNNTYNLNDLQIESVSETGNASEVELDIDNNQLIYRPMSGYWGADNFTISVWNGRFQDEIVVIINIQRDYQLSVDGSSHASARYLPDTNVSITADQAPAGESFHFWQAVDSEQPITELINDVESETAIVTMPSFELNINAIYQPIGTVDTESPTAPDNFRFTSIGSTTVVLAWDASTDNVAVSNYQISELGSGRTLTTESTSIRFNNLASNSLYTYQIIAIDSAGNQSTIVVSEQITTNSTEELRVYHFGHSLMIHQRTNNPIYEQSSDGSRNDKELSILHWMKQLTDTSGNTYFADGQYRNQVEVGYTIPATTNVHWPWKESETSVWDNNFTNSAYNTVLYTDLNFVQGNRVDEPYNNSSLTPIQMFQRIITYNELQPNTPIYLYASWADAGPIMRDAGYAQGVSPPTLVPNSTEVNAYYGFAIGVGASISSYEQWWRDLYQATRSMGNVIYMPVNWILIRTIRDSGYLNNAQFGDLFEDKAPHGRASVYLMAAMIQYVVMNNSIPIAPQNLSSEVIHPDIINNFDAIASFMLTEWQSVRTELSIE